MHLYLTGLGASSRQESAQQDLPATVLTENIPKLS